MPFTPLHLGPGMAVKAVGQGKFSLIVYGWAQVLVDIQPLVVILSGEGQLHGITHTFAGGAVLGAAAALSGKYLAESLLNLFRKKSRPPVQVSWPVAWWSGLLGGLGHVLMDSLIYSDMNPFWPFVKGNPLCTLTDSQMLAFCLYSGMVGLMVYSAVKLVESLKKRISGQGLR
ncbi:MAG: hypothetical protein WA116_04270 [Anaerolineaceae bacterium]